MTEPDGWLSEEELKYVLAYNRKNRNATLVEQQQLIEMALAARVLLREVEAWRDLRGCPEAVESDMEMRALLAEADTDKMLSQHLPPLGGTTAG